MMKVKHELAKPHISLHKHKTYSTGRVRVVTYWDIDSAFHVGISTYFNGHYSGVVSVSAYAPPGSTRPTHKMAVIRAALNIAAETTNVRSGAIESLLMAAEAEEEA